MLAIAEPHAKPKAECSIHATPKADFSPTTDLGEPLKLTRMGSPAAAGSL
jgi:hypothetical protein